MANNTFKASDFTGTVTVNTIGVYSGTTATVFNATATTVNAFGAATAINMGATAGTHSMQGTWLFNNNTFNPIQVRRAINTATAGSGVTIVMNDSGNNSHEYGYISAVIVTNTDGAEVGKLVLKAANSGAANANTSSVEIAADGSITTTGGLTLGDAKNIATNTTTGTKFPALATQKWGAWGATPVIQPASANQAALGAVPTIAGVDTVNEANITSFLGSIRTLVNQLRSDLVTAGIIKGSA